MEIKSIFITVGDAIQIDSELYLEVYWNVFQDKEDNFYSDEGTSDIDVIVYNGVEYSSSSITPILQFYKEFKRIDVWGVIDDYIKNLDINQFIDSKIVFLK